MVCATPRPLCSLTEKDFGLTRHQRQPYQQERIAEFAAEFGQPALELTIDEHTRTICKATVSRDAVCGCARHVAEGLVGLSVDEAEEKTGLLHHHYPCLASMQKLADFNHDTLMHASGQILKNQVSKQLKPFRNIRYITPGKQAN